MAKSLFYSFLTVFHFKKSTLRLPWGIIDIVSFTTGEMKKRYGLIYVDRDNEGRGTLERLKKDSFYWYQKVIETNGKDLGE